MKDPVYVDMDDYSDLCEDNAGVCLHCGELNYGFEPDCETGECEICGHNEVWGIEGALLSGAITLIRN